MERKNPETSIEAYRSLKSDEIRVIYKVILDSLNILNLASSEQIHEFSQKEHPKIKHEQIWKRMIDLCRLELIYRPGNKVRTKSGRSAFQWAITGKHFPNIQPVERSMKGPTIADFSREINKITQSTLF